MNFEEMLNSQENGPLHSEKLPLGKMKRKQVDGKYRYVVELRADLADNLLFCEALKAQKEWVLKHRIKQQLLFTLSDECNSKCEIELEPGHYQTLAEQVKVNPAVVAGKNFIDNLMESLFDGVAKLHNEGVYHLCFAPENVLLRKNDHSAFMLTHGSLFSKSDTILAVFEDCKDYLAPEIIAGEKGDERSDIYSLGKLISFLYDQGSMPYEYKRIVKKATAENPDKRFRSVEDMRTALHNARNFRRSAITMISVIIISLIVVFIYIDMTPKTEAIEFVEPAPKSQSDSIYDESYSDMYDDDTLSANDEFMQYQKKAEEIFRKRYQQVADQILSKVYDNEHMGSSEKAFMANSHSMFEELLKAQRELAEEAGIPESTAGKIGDEIVEQITKEKQKNLQHKGYVRPKND